MRDVLAFSAFLLGTAGLVVAATRATSGRGSAPSPARRRGGALQGALALAGVALLVLGVGVVLAPDTGPVALRSATPSTWSRGRPSTPTPAPTPARWDPSPVGAYRRSVDASCEAVDVGLRTPADSSRESIVTALRLSAASYEDLANGLDAVEPPPRLLNRHHRLVTAVRRTGVILRAAAAQLRVGSTGGYADRLAQLPRSVTDLDRQARGLQVPHCRPT